ncbi:hypothetical protein QYE77_14030 [Thermanaerothrix sp. 4228-RoL]|uniref:Cytochrome c-552/4 domain-containing protein n=1 Tax=Thermanaerothrix solaris TaxID=3058434 RepID=A0ABU3NRB4_9CHLR|nr:hypothetical protein [Thermanaerothrix sp. 4228-RoL]MDT8899381.1 hypothetical protein [Thermanaerothrix sp. 4228-RoL]
MSMNRASRWAWVALAMIIVGLTACSQNALQPTLTPTTSSRIPGSLIRFRGNYFSTAGECGYCHTALKSVNGTVYSIQDDWRSTLMANAGRDPYYLAHVAEEVNRHPQHREVIEAKCATCHIGMASLTEAFSNSEVAILGDQGLLNPDNPLYPLALDGVSCSLCHQIQDINLGTPQSFSGGFNIDSNTPAGKRIVYGRFDVNPAMATVMQSASGFIPQTSAHVTRSEFCAVCHNLFTPYVDDNGNLSTDLFAEQTPYTEWVHSAYRDSQACQDCHMPTATEAVPVANTGSPMRDPYHQHYFVGGNQWMLNLLKTHPDKFAVSAESAQFDQTIARTLDQLQTKTAHIQLTAEPQDQSLKVNVRIDVLTGHKFPTSFPSRRAWIHMIVRDADGKVLFESGAFQPDGSIIGNDNDGDETKYEPHYQIITRPDQVQIYEPIIGDPNGQVTTSLLRAQRYLKDNRLLPTGLDKNTLPSEIAVYGEALQDPDFQAGGDIVHYQISFDSPPTYPLSIEASLYYQSIGFRWMHKFSSLNLTAAQNFMALAASVPNSPIPIATARITLNTVQP